MIRIRRVFDDALPADAEVIARAGSLLRACFPSARQEEFEDLAGKLRNPFEQRFRNYLYVSEDAKGRLRGCALVSHDPEASFVLLDWLASAQRETGGVGAGLFSQVRDDALGLGCLGVFFECLSDLPEEIDDPRLLKDNARRLAFYERFGARPIVGTAWREPVRPGGGAEPWLVWCPTPADATLSAAQLRPIARAILERKYGWLCPPEYVEHVLESIADPVRRRPPLYAERRKLHLPPPPSTATGRIGMVVHDGHALHHVRERGYVESPVRVDRILSVLEPTGWFERVTVERFPTSALTTVHDPEYVDWLERVCATIQPGRNVYPYVFPVRNAKRMPDDLQIRAGFYCLDTFTPLHRELFGVARAAADCVLTATRLVGERHAVAYALVRPPGHHAETGRYGGFCYFSHLAIAAQDLVSRGRRVAILDIDHHHGNGQQEIFYGRSDVLTVSIHGDPSFAYPYFTGFADEVGEGDGVGFNLNLPLPEHTDGPAHDAALHRGLSRIAEHRPDVLLVGFGLDTAQGDPTGTWSLREQDFHANGRRIGGLGLPVLVVQEGGYGLRALGRNALAFLVGVEEGRARAAARA